MYLDPGVRYEKHTQSLCICVYVCLCVKISDLGPDCPTCSASEGRIEKHTHSLCMCVCVCVC